MIRFLSLLLLTAFLCWEANAAVTKINISLVNIELVDSSVTRPIDWPEPLPSPVPYTIRKLIKVTFFTLDDLRRFAQKGARISATAVICGKEKEFSSTQSDMATDVVDGNGIILDSSRSDIAQPKSGIHYAYLATISPKSFPQSPTVSYNFLKKIEPICFNVTGASMGIGEVMRSNIVVIDRATLRKAFLASTTH
jgi:hypothetical protein